MKELISVIVPVYKTELYIRACVDSILAQTYSNIEVILVDDGSPDQCPDICDAYARQDARVRVIHQKNQGLSAARNRGIEDANGAYFALLDSDDLYAPQFLERLYQSVSDTGADFAVCRFERFREKPEIQQLREPVQPMCLSQMEAFECLFDTRNETMVVAVNKLYSRQLFHSLRYPVGRIHEDEAVIHELLGLAHQVAWLDEPLYYYRTTENSITTSRFSVRNLDEMIAKEERIAYFEAHHMQDFADRTRQIYLSNLMRLYRTAQAEMSRGKERKETLQTIYTKFCEIYEKKLVQGQSSAMRLRCAAFRTCPYMFSLLDHTRLQRKGIM